MADVMAYEQGETRVLDTFKAGYPRFFRNPLLQALATRLSHEGLAGAADPLLPTRETAIDLCRFLDVGESSIREGPGCWSVRLSRPGEQAPRAKAYLQHTGNSLSSREAEAILATCYDHPRFTETRASGDAQSHEDAIRNHLHSVYGTASPSEIRLYRSGMNAFYAGYRALQAIQARRGRDLWIQLGWLYVDTTRVLEVFNAADTPPIQLQQVLDLTELKQCLADEGHRVAGIVTEVPTNPLVHTPDLEQLRQLADRYKAGLILDPTLVSPHNVNILEYADLHINSLTKYAAAEADVMMGALALNPGSRFYDDLLVELEGKGSAPGAGDLARMAAQITRYDENIRRINASTLEVVDFLEGHPGVREVHWARRQPSGWNYNWIQHREAGPGGIITLFLKRPLQAFYDPSRLVKSPSFGARFTMMCPFLYLAHYDLVSTSEGRAKLTAQGLDPDLVRLSIGLEDPTEIMAALEETL